MPKAVVETPTVTLNISPEFSRAMTTLASAIIFAAPAFATNATPTNIVSMADLLNRFVKGDVTVSQPSDEVQNPPASNGATFG